MIFSDLLSNMVEWGSQIIDVFGSYTIFNVFTASIGDSFNDLLEFFYDIPIIGSVLEDTIGDLIATAFGNFNLLNFMINVGVPAMVAYSFIKWLVGIVTGS